MKVLWIDDEVDLMKPFIYLLNQEGYEVKPSTSGEDGLSLLKKEPFDIVFLDEIMPGIDGLEVLKKIKGKNPQQLVVMITKSEEEELMERAYSDWVDDYITKPFSFNQILSVLNRTLKRRQLIEKVIIEEYSQQMKDLELPSSYRGWISYYEAQVAWDLKLLELGDQSLREIHDAKKIEANSAFNKYIEKNYRSLLQEGPIFSHKFFQTIVAPYLREGPVYLFILDSMRLDQYVKIQPYLRDHFEVSTDYYYSILPSATPYSRNSLMAGFLPLDIIKEYPLYWTFEEKGQNRFEKELFIEQMKRLGYTKKEIQFYKVVTLNDISKSIGAVLAKEADIVIYIVNFLDILIHSIPGRENMKGLLNDERVFLNLLAFWFPTSPLFELLRRLAQKKRRIIFTTDHGFIRVKRPVLVYGGREISSNLRYKYGPALRSDPKGAIILESPSDFMLPSENVSVRFLIAREDYYFIYPTKPSEYEQEFKFTLQHGGISMEEMILPFGILKAR